ncbi:MAG: hypothetical protein C5B58_13995, partial [Acidobacteria bacterium]
MAVLVRLLVGFHGIWDQSTAWLLVVHLVVHPDTLGHSMLQIVLEQTANVPHHVRELSCKMIAWVTRQLNDLESSVSMKRKVIKPLWLAADRIVHRRAIKLMEDLPAFVPNSAGGHPELAKLTLQSAHQTFPLIAQLIAARGEGRRLLSVTAFSNSERARAAARQFKIVLDKHGSDKATNHDYHHLYGAILADS